VLPVADDLDVLAVKGRGDAVLDALRVDHDQVRSL
jgi:hypothetical protein